MISLVLSIIAVVISFLTLIFYLFQEYRELITIYWFAEYDVIFIPRDAETMVKPSEFVENYLKDFHRCIQVCDFKHKWVGRLDRVYYQQSINDYAKNLDELLVKSFMIDSAEYNVIARVIVTRHGRKSLNCRVKNVRKAV